MFSVIIPLYNRERFIARAIGSVLAQTVEDFEVIVVDDGSNDRGPDIVESYKDPRIRLVRQENSGAGAARNRGIQEATRPYVTFLDSDDTWDRHRLEAPQQTLEKFPEAAFMAAAYRMIYGPRVCIEQTRVSSELIFKDDYLESMLTGSGGCSTCAVTLRRDVALELGGFPDIPTGEDGFLWLQTSRRYPLYYCNNPVFIYDKTPHPHITTDPDLNRGRERMEGFSRVIDWIESEMENEQDPDVKAKLARIQHFYFLKAGEGVLYHDGLFSDFLERNRRVTVMPDSFLKKGNCFSTRLYFKKTGFKREARNVIAPLLMRFYPWPLKFKCVQLRRVPFDYDAWKV